MRRLMYLETASELVATTLSSCNIYLLFALSKAFGRNIWSLNPHRIKTFALPWQSMGLLKAHPGQTCWGIIHLKRLARNVKHPLSQSLKGRWGDTIVIFATSGIPKGMHALKIQQVTVHWSWAYESKGRQREFILCYLNLFSLIYSCIGSIFVSTPSMAHEHELQLCDLAVDSSTWSFLYHNPYSVIFCSLESFAACIEPDLPYA